MNDIRSLLEKLDQINESAEINSAIQQTIDKRGLPKNVSELEVDVKDTVKRIRDFLQSRDSDSFLQSIERGAKRLFMSADYIERQYLGTVAEQLKLPGLYTLDGKGYVYTEKEQGGRYKSSRYSSLEDAVKLWKAGWVSRDKAIELKKDNLNRAFKDEKSIANVFFNSNPGPAADWIKTNPLPKDGIDGDEEKPGSGSSDSTSTSTSTSTSAPAVTPSATAGDSSAATATPVKDQPTVTATPLASKTIFPNLDKFLQSGNKGLYNARREFPNATGEAQKLLMNFGLNTGGEDKVYGSKTIQAVRKFQKAAGINVDGDIGPETIEKLKYYTIKIEDLDELLSKYKIDEAIEADSEEHKKIVALHNEVSEFFQKLGGTPKKYEELMRKSGVAKGMPEKLIPASGATPNAGEKSPQSSSTASSTPQPGSETNATEKYKKFFTTKMTSSDLSSLSQTDIDDLSLELMNELRLLLNILKDSKLHFKSSIAVGLVESEKLYEKDLSASEEEKLKVLIYNLKLIQPKAGPVYKARIGNYLAGVPAKYSNAAGNQSTTTTSTSPAAGTTNNAPPAAGTTNNAPPAAGTTTQPAASTTTQPAASTTTQPAASTTTQPTIAKAEIGRVALAIKRGLQGSGLFTAVDQDDLDKIFMGIKSKADFDAINAVYKASSRNDIITDVNKEWFYNKDKQFLPMLKRLGIPNK